MSGSINKAIVVGDRGRDPHGRGKAEVASRLVMRRGLSEPEAALYVGIGSSKFRQLVVDGRMPRPRLLDSRRVWDVDELDAAFRSLPREGGETEIDTWADVV